MGEHESEREPRLRGLTGLFLVACTPLLSAPSAFDDEGEVFVGVAYEQVGVLEEITSTFDTIKKNTSLKVEEQKVLENKMEALKSLLSSLDDETMMYDPEVKVALEGALKVYQTTPSSDPAGALEELNRLEENLKVALKPPKPSPAATKPAAVDPLSVFSSLCPSTTLEKDPPYLSGHLGAANWFENKVGYDGDLNGQKLQDVLVHECAHIHQYNSYQGDVETLKRDMNVIYGGEGFDGLEANADCMALLWGVSWTHYTSDCSGQRGIAAEKIIENQKSM